MTEPSTCQVMRWLTSITRPENHPLYFSALMRVVHLLADIVCSRWPPGNGRCCYSPAGRGWDGCRLAAVQALAYYLAASGGNA